MLLPNRFVKRPFPLHALLLTLILITACQTAPAVIEPTPTPAPTYNTTGPAISPLLVGNNVWMYPSDPVWQASQAAGLQLVRIGGIAYDDHLPAYSQLTTWVNQIKALGAEPMLQVSRHDTPEKAAEVVAYFNVENNNRITYWNIGNEPYCGEDSLAAAADVAAYVKALATAMKAVDPTIQIFAPDECDLHETYYGALLAGDNSANDISGLVPGQDYYYIDGISWHRYIGYPPQQVPVAGLTTDGFTDFLVRIEKTRSLIDAANAAQERTGTAALQWGIGEFNSSEGERVCSFENGQMFAQLYGAIMKYGGTYGATWSMLENGGRCFGTDFSFLNQDLSPRATYYHMQMVAQNFRGFYLDGASSVAAVQAFGAVDSVAEQVVVLLMNTDTAVDHTCTIYLTSQPSAADETGCAVQLDAGVTAVATQPIPRQTSILLTFNAQGQLIQTSTYSLADHWQNGLPPTIVSLSGE